MSSLTATVSRPGQLGAHDKDHTPASQPTLTHWSSGMVPPAGYLSWLHSPAGDGHREHSACTACGSLCAEALRGASPAWRLTCTAPGPRLMAFPVPTVPSLAHFVTIQPTLKGPARPSIMPFLRTKLAFPKFPQHSVCGPLSLPRLNLSVAVPILRDHTPGAPEGLLNCYMLMVSPA